MKQFLSAWWLLCLAMYAALVVSFLVIPEQAVTWLFVEAASTAAVVELTAFYTGNMALVCVLLWRWRRQPSRWLGLVATLNTLVLLVRVAFLIQHPDTIDGRMLGYLGGELVLASVSWFLRYRTL